MRALQGKRNVDRFIYHWVRESGREAGNGDKGQIGRSSSAKLKSHSNIGVKIQLILVFISHNEF